MCVFALNEYVGAPIAMLTIVCKVADRKILRTCSLVSKCLFVGYPKIILKPYGYLQHVVEKYHKRFNHFQLKYFEVYVMRCPKKDIFPPLFLIENFLCIEFSNTPLERYHERRLHCCHQCELWCCFIYELVFVYT